MLLFLGLKFLNSDTKTFTSYLARHGENWNLFNPKKKRLATHKLEIKGLILLLIFSQVVSFQTFVWIKKGAMVFQDDVSTRRYHNGEGLQCIRWNLIRHTFLNSFQGRKYYRVSGLFACGGYDSRGTSGCFKLD